MGAIISDVEVRPSRTNWILLGSPGLIIGAFSAFEALTLERARGLLVPSMICGLIGIGCLYWLATTKLTLTNDRVRYRALLVRKEIPLAKIAGVRFEFGAQATKPMQRVVLQTDGTEVVINAGLFGHQETRRWVDSLKARLS